MHYLRVCLVYVAPYYYKQFRNDLNDQCCTKNIHFFYLTNNYFNNVMSTTVLLGLMSFEKKLGASGFFEGPVTFSDVLAPWLQELNVEGCMLNVRRYTIWTE